MIEKHSSKYDLAAAAMCGVAWVFWSYINKRMALLLVGGWDISLYNQAMWSVCHGVSKPSFYETSFLADHLNFVAYLLAPFYFFFQEPSTLMQLKVFAFCSGGLIFYHCIKPRLGAVMSLVFLIIYFIFPANVAMLFFPFNYENLAIPFIFLMFFFWDRGRFKSFMLTALMLCLIKEHLPTIVVMFGFLGLWQKKGDRLRWGVIPIVFGISFFWIEMFVLMPWIRQDLASHQSNYWTLFDKVSSDVTPKAIIYNIFAHPTKTLSLLFSPINLKYLHQLFAGVSVAALLSPHILFLGGALLMSNLLSHFIGQQTIEMYYHATIAPFIFMAVTNSMTYVKGRLRWAFFAVVAIIMLVNCAIYVPTWLPRLNLPFNQKSITQVAMADLIPKKVNLLVSSAFASHLSGREYIYYLGRPRNYFINDDPHIPYEKINWAIINFADKWMSPEALKSFFDSGRWKLISIVDETAVFRKDANQGFDLIEANPKQWPLPSDCRQKLLVSRNKDVGLDCVQVPTVKAGQRVIPVVFYWRSLQETSKHYQVSVALKVGRDLEWLHQREIGYHFMPTSSWKQGEKIKEAFYYSIPQNLSAGHYQLNVYLLDNKSLAVTIPINIQNN